MSTGGGGRGVGEGSEQVFLNGAELWFCEMKKFWRRPFDNVSVLNATALCT